jgi:UrcA family protein
MTASKMLTVRAAAILTLLGAPAAAMAQSGLVVTGVPDLPTASVSYADLDLSSAAGRAKLNARIRSAADRLCAYEGVQPVQEKSERRQCFQAAMASTEDQVAGVTSNQATRFAGRRTIEMAARR